MFSREGSQHSPIFPFTTPPTPRPFTHSPLLSISIEHDTIQIPRKSKFEYEYGELKVRKYLKMRVFFRFQISRIFILVLPLLLSLASFTFRDKLFPINLNIFHVSEYLKMTMIIPKCPVLVAGYWLDRRQVN